MSRVAWALGGSNEADRSVCRYVEFDFHAECRGMKYENISKLTDSLTQDLEETRCVSPGVLPVFTHSSSQLFLGYGRSSLLDASRSRAYQLHRLPRSVRGVILPRNCSLTRVYRTNVVQSAISRWVVNRHLVHLGITTQEEVGMHDELDQRFNEIWADNGDAISREVSCSSQEWAQGC